MTVPFPRPSISDHLAEFSCSVHRTLTPRRIKRFNLEIEAFVSCSAKPSSFSPLDDRPAISKTPWAFEPYLFKFNNKTIFCLKKCDISAAACFPARSSLDETHVMHSTSIQSPPRTHCVKLLDQPYPRPINS